jgi:hypothetical protein
MRTGHDAVERVRLLGGWYLLYIAFMTLPVTFYRVLHPNGWTPGDWLVNYTAGFVRRGLPGESILLLSHGLHVSPLAVGVLAPLALYLLLYGVIWKLFEAAQGGLWTLLALMSPASLAFPILDPVAALRKELLTLVALGGMLWWLTRGPARDRALIAFLTLAAPVILLSHEGMLPFLLYLFAGLLVAFHDIRRVLRIAALPAVAALVALVAVSLHHGTPQVQATICQSIQPAPALVCRGSIAYLSNGTDAARADVVHDLHAYHYLLFYPLLTLLAAVPLAGMAFSLYGNRRARTDLLYIGGTTMVALLVSVPLFVLAMDWGRWIYIHLLCVYLLLLFARIRQVQAQEPTPEHIPAIVQAHPRWAALVLVLYVTCWNIPHFGNYPKKGYLNLPLHMLKQRLHHDAHSLDWNLD